MSIYLPFRGRDRFFNLGGRPQEFNIYKRFATGGTVTYDGDYKIHTFTSSGTLIVSEDVEVQVLVVAGGGSGMPGNSLAWEGGGGGAGGLLHKTDFGLSEGEYSITVGAGGSASNGGNSSLGDLLIAIGGGRGGQNSDGSDGGSGGGGTYNGRAGGNPVSGQGHAGESHAGIPSGYGGGGGGAGEAGGTDGVCQGGDGVLLSIAGSPVYYAGGGGGCPVASGTTLGGEGGGGNGGNGTPGTAGAANTGGGGGGSLQNTAAGNGGSGVVIIRYKYR